MKRRITISLEADLERTIRNKQANMLLKSNHSVSFSEMLNRILREALKNDDLDVGEPTNKATDDQSMMMKAKRSGITSKLLNSVQSQAKSREKNMEIESKLNSIYNRVA